MNHSDKPSATVESASVPSSAIRRGWWVLFAIALLAVGVFGAVLSIKLRRTQTAKTEQLLGIEAIRALQSSAIFRLRVAPDGELISAMEASDGTVELGTIPSIGHLRHAFLDQRHYDWTSEQTTSSADLGLGESAEWVSIELEGTPPGLPEIESTVLQYELSEGWVGVAGGSHWVRFNDRVAPAVRKQVTTMSKVRSERADQP